jgi:hypothetical protein
MIDVSDPNFNPKAMFRKFKRYLRTCKKRDYFDANMLMNWLCLTHNYKYSSDWLEDFQKLISCWSQCGLIEFWSRTDKNENPPYRSWKIKKGMAKKREINDKE